MITQPAEAIPTRTRRAGSRPIARMTLPATLLATLLAVAAAGPAAAGWGDVGTPTSKPAQVIGGHAAGCIDGAAALPQDGPGFQVMRPSRNRYYGHPALIAFVQDLADRAGAIGIPGLLIGDLGQPRGGPMTSGHRSHQSGLDVDIWFRFAPSQPLTRREREDLSAISMLRADASAPDPALWSPAHVELLRIAALDPRVDRIFVNPAIKRGLCASVDGDRDWLGRIRPWWGHDSHFHVGLRCPAVAGADGGDDCLDRLPAPPPGDGCDASLDWWFSAEAAEDLRRARAAPPKPVSIDDLPIACRAVLDGG